MQGKTKRRRSNYAVDSKSAHHGGGHKLSYSKGKEKGKKKKKRKRVAINKVGAGQTDHPSFSSLLFPSFTLVSFW
jgi:hypothetical protein